MKLTAQLKLQPTSEQAAMLRRTLEQANAACNYISDVAWTTSTFGKFALQQLCYQDVRKQFALSAQVTIRCLAKVGDSYKLDRKTQRTFKSLGSIAYDDRILSFNLKGSCISIWTLDGRLAIPFVCGERQRSMLLSRQGESDLVFHRDNWYLLVTCEIADPDPMDVDAALGIDMGIVTIAADSDGEHHTGVPIETKRQWYAKRRAALQRVGTKSAKRRLRRLRGRQRRFQQNTNHVISKRIVAKAKRTKRAIAIENLTGIRLRARVKGPQQRARHSNWAFNQLRRFLTYKAQLAGVPLVTVDPAYTSQRCSVCGHTERANRRSQAVFCCVSCGYTSQADLNAAINIERVAVIPPMVSALRG